MNKRVVIAAGAAGVVVAIIAFVLSRPVPPMATSGHLPLGESWTSPYGVSFEYDRWQGEPRDAFHLLIENKATKERLGLTVEPRGADKMRETFGVPWHVVSFEGMTTDGSDWVVVEALKPAPTPTTTTTTTTK